MDIKRTVGKKVYSFHVRKAITYIKEHYEKPLNLEGMAEYLGLNKCYFCNLFKKEVGKTYSHFVNEIRIKKSKDLLVNTNLSMLEIALSVGYNNQNYYNMAFKKIVGVTPLKYRRFNK
ncbi:MAG: helix-turn-helix transcriptional regulator [Epulopiscium sp.]|nr:helix-turn-helix transcriptional regulator [Candidatus Epulonipiscium sp.]